MKRKAASPSGKPARGKSRTTGERTSRPSSATPKTLASGERTSALRPPVNKSRAAGATIAQTAAFDEVLHLIETARRRAFQAANTELIDLIVSQRAQAKFDQAKALFSDWKSADILFQLTDEEISSHTTLFKDTTVKPGLLQSYLFLAIEINGGDYARGKLTGLARQINRVFPMPVMVLIKHLADKKPVLSIAVINRPPA